MRRENEKKEEEKRRDEEVKRKEEEQRQKEEMRRENEKKEEEKRRDEEVKRKEEEQRQKEEMRREKERKEEEKRRDEEVKRREEEQRQEEEIIIENERRDEVKRIEEEQRKEELRRENERKKEGMKKVEEMKSDKEIRKAEQIKIRKLMKEQAEQTDTLTTRQGLNFTKDSDKLEKKLQVVREINKNGVKLNVGGHMINTSLPVLRGAGGIFPIIFKDAVKEFYLDRDGSVYEYIINFLRCETSGSKFSQSLLPNNNTELQTIMMEASFLELPKLFHLCKEKRDKLLDWGV